MNTIWIVLPVLTVLMFDLGLTLSLEDFKRFSRRPRPLIAGMLGQLVALPALAFALGVILKLDGAFLIGFVLIACCPGGSSSNVFSMLAKGDVALSVSLTVLSSLLTFFTIPLIMSAVGEYASGAGTTIRLDVGKLMLQNVVLTLLPVFVGIWVRKSFAVVAQRIHAVLSKIAFPSILLLAGVFFVAHRGTIVESFGRLGLSTSVLIVSAMTLGAVLSRLFALSLQERRTIVIEVGMQNAAQAIAIACSPFVYNEPVIAVPAIVYALMMNLILLVYLLACKNLEI